METNETLLSLVGNMKRATRDEHHGPCFKCGGRDRFIVFNNGTAWCRQCQWKGDAIQLLRDRDGLSFKDAAAAIGKDIEPRQQTKSTRARRAPAPAIHASSPKMVDFDQAAWSANAYKLMMRAMEMLVINEEGKKAEEYLRARGLNLSTLCGAFIGFIPKEYETFWGGLKVKVERGISIPWFDGQKIVHKLNVRTDNPDMRYKAVTGSVNGAYLSYRVRPGDVVVLVEGEIDALSIASATDFKVCGVATGSTMGGRLLSVVAKLALARRVLVAFDADAPGEAAAQWWLQALPNSKRHLPTRHDVNDMLREDGSDGVNEWIDAGMTDPVRPVMAARPVPPRPAPAPKPAAPPTPAQAVTLPGLGFSSYHNGGL